MPPRPPPLNWGLLPPSFLLPSGTRSLLPVISQTSNALPPNYTPVRTIKSTLDPRPDRFAYSASRKPLESTSTAALARKDVTTPLRTGALAIKKGMTSLYDPNTGKRMACTVLQFDRNEVIAHKTREKNGYYAVQVGAGAKLPWNVTRPMLGHFANAGVAPKRWMAEFKVKDMDGLKIEVGQMIGPSWFTEGQWVDVKGTGKGKGFAGVCLGSLRHVYLNADYYIGYEAPRLRWSTGVPWSVTHASRHGFRRWFSRLRFSCPAREKNARSNGR